MTRGHMISVKMALGYLTLLGLFTAVSAYTHGNGGFVATGRMSLRLNNNFGFKVAVDKDVWLEGSRVFMTVNNKTYTTEDGSLQLIKKSMDKGSDALGKWQATRYQFQPFDMKNRMIASVYTYTDMPFMIFEQAFPDGAEGTSTGDANKVCTGFPSISPSNTNQTLGFHAFGGIMFGNTNMRTGKWGSKMTTMPVSGLDSGPLLLFDSKDNAVIISSFTNFMAGSATYDSSPTRMNWGLLGKAKSIPKGFRYSVILYHSKEGINDALSGWGYTLRKYYNRHQQFRYSDFSNNYLGYYTDNGAYYYYKTEANKTYAGTLYDVQDYAKSLNIPYRYVQYDSWWYYQGPHKGVTEWVSMDSIFPKGMRSSETKYAKQNGGKYNFIIEASRKKALPMDQMFWDDLMSSSRQWGLMTYEQDWLNVQFDQMDATVSDLNIGRTWLRQMGHGAAKNGLTIQYCMSPSRHALQSLEIPVVSQARVSTDYLLSPEQWRIGISSLFAHAIGVAPFKDNFWTTSRQPGNPYDKSEPHPILQSVVATLSTGPVAPSDKIGYSNRSLIMRSCDSDGRLLKPNRPALAINDQIKMAAAGSPIGEIWTTYSEVSGLKFGIILAADIKAKYSIGPTKAGFGNEFPSSRVFAYNPTSAMAAMFTDASPLEITPSCGSINFCLFHTTPVLSWQGQELLIYGELDKWVPMSSQRFKAVMQSSTDVTIDLEGGVGEKVNLTITFGGKLMTFTCRMGEDGRAKFSLLNKMC